MTIPNYCDGITRVVQISTNTAMGCEDCCDAGTHFDSLDVAINHHIAQHGYRLLHVGTETIPDSKGNPWHSTIAVLGK